MILRAPSAEHHSLQGCRSWFIHRLWSRPACPGGRGAKLGYAVPFTRDPIVARRKQLAFGGTACG